MAKKATTDTPKLIPSLKVPRADATKKLSEQKKIGEAIRDRPILTWDELETARADRRRWKDYVTLMLKKLLTTDEFSRTFENSSKGSYDVNLVPSLPDDARDYRDDMQASINELQSIMDRLPLLDEPDHANSTAATDSYDVAQVCLNGHVINEYSNLQSEFNTPHCEKCGEKTITLCPKCSAPLRGGYIGQANEPKYSAPAFCYKCGGALPWTDMAIEAAIQLASESGDLNEQEQQQFSESIHNVVRDTPKAQVAGSRIARLLGKMGKATANAVRDVLVDVASETAKKMIWPERQ